MKYDLIVIGGGPAGYTAAIRASKLGKNVALIEQHQLGGTCLNRGCIPTKVLLHSGELYKNSSEWQELGIIAENVVFDEAKAYLRKEGIVKGLRDGIENLIKANNIAFFNGKGIITGEHTVEVNSEILEADFILIATGSRPAGFDERRPINGIESALTSDDVLSAPIKGNDIVVIGAGVIGVEFAVYFSSIGKNVTLLASGDRILKMMSKELSVQLSSVLKRMGIKILINAKINEVTENSVEYEFNGTVNTINADSVIAALGRNSNIHGIGLESIGITAEKSIKADDNMNVGIRNIYACGDVIGGIQLAHYAAASAITAVDSMFGHPHSIDLNTVPSCIYTSPEIASVGKNESEVENAKVGKFLMGANGKSIIEGQNRGYIKVISDQNDKIVGAEVFSVRGTDIIGELALAISAGLTVEQASRVIHAHPTVYEAVNEAYEDIYGLATHMLPKRR